jgi:hypothetical protein
MAKLLSPKGSMPKILGAVTFLLVAAHSQAADTGNKEAIKIDNNSFKCITEMTKVRHFYVDNLRGDLDGTVAVAKAGKGDYPEGPVI